MADAEHIDNLLQGAEKWNAYVKKQPPDFIANLTGADLCGVDLTGANLAGADINGAVYNDSTVWPRAFDPELAGARKVDYGEKEEGGGIEQTDSAEAAVPVDDSEDRDVGGSGVSGWVVRWWKPVSGVLTAVVLLSAAVGAVASLSSRVSGVLPGTAPYSPETSDELLILIADFGEPVQDKAAPHVEIAEELDTQIEEQGLEGVRWEYLEESIERTDKAGRVDELEDEASMVIWGDRTAATVVTKFRSFRDDVDLPFEERIEQPRGSDAQPVSSLASLPDEGEFITEGLPDQVSFIALYLIAVLEYQAGDVEEAARVMEAGLELSSELDPDGVAIAHFSLGLYRQELGQLKQAIESYDQSIELDPNDTDAFNNRGIAYNDLGESERAIKDYDKAIELDPNNALAFNNRGVAYNDLGDFERAIEDHDKAIELDPNNAVIFYNRGIAYDDLGEFERAIEDYDKAIELDPNDAGAFNNRGVAYNGLGEFERAIEDYDKAIKLDPNDALAFANRGGSYDGLGEFERAIEDHDKAIELDPNNVLAWRNRGVTLGKLGEFERAIEDYDKAIELDPNDATTFYNRGLAYSVLSDFERGIEDYDKAIELDPNNAEWFLNRGGNYNGLKEYERAIEDFTQAIELDPNNAGAFTLRGLAYSILSEFERAIGDYDKAIEILQEDESAHPNLNIDDIKQFRERAAEQTE